MILRKDAPKEGPLEEEMGGVMVFDKVSLAEL